MAVAADLKPPPTIDSLALKFCEELRATLTHEQMENVVSINAAEANPNVRHSHDFRDANIVLNDVFLRHDMDAADEGGMDRWGDLWNQTWNLAKSRGFRMFKRGDKVEILKEFQDKGDDEFTWIALGDEEKGRLDIMPVEIDLEIRPIYVAHVDWIKLS